MKTITISIILTSLIFITTNANASSSPDGAKIAKKCTACHTLNSGGKNKIGPNLFAIVGRGAAEIEGFKYSKALLAKKEEGLVWDKETLDKFLKKPKKFIKGTKMAFAGIKKEESRAALISYLETLK